MAKKEIVFRYGGGARPGKNVEEDVEVKDGFDRWRHADGQTFVYFRFGSNPSLKAYQFVQVSS